FDSDDDENGRKKFSIFSPWGIAGLCLLASLAYFFTDSDRMKALIGSSPAVNQVTAPANDAASPAPPEQQPLTERLPVSAPKPQTKSRGDYISDPSQQAVGLVKNYPLGGDRGNISRRLEWEFLSPGREADWAATSENADL